MTIKDHKESPPTKVVADDAKASDFGVLLNGAAERRLRISRHLPTPT